MKEIKNFTDIGYAVVAEVKDDDVHVDFKVYEIYGEVFNMGEKVGILNYHGNNGEFTPDIDKAKLYLHGTIKWDGCSDWWFDEQERRVMLHFCGRRDMRTLGLLFDMMYEMMPDLLGDKYDKDCADHDCKLRI